MGGLLNLRWLVIWVGWSQSIRDAEIEQLYHCQLMGVNDGHTERWYFSHPQVGDMSCLIPLSSWSLFCYPIGFCTADAQQFLETQGWMLLAIARLEIGFQIAMANKTVNDLSIQS